MLSTALGFKENMCFETFLFNVWFLAYELFLELAAVGRSP